MFSNQDVLGAEQSSICLLISSPALRFMVVSSRTDTLPRSLESHPGFLQPSAEKDAVGLRLALLQGECRSVQKRSRALDPEEAFGFRRQTERAEKKSLRSQTGSLESQTMSACMWVEKRADWDSNRTTKIF